MYQNDIHISNYPPHVTARMIQADAFYEWVFAYLFADTKSQVIVLAKLFLITKTLAFVVTLCRRIVRSASVTRNVNVLLIKNNILNKSILSLGLSCR